MKLVYNAIKLILDLLPKKDQIKMFGIAILLLINSLLELLGLGAILPVFSVLLEDNVVEKYSWASWVYNFFKLTDERQLIILLATSLFIVILVKNILSLWIAKINSTFALSLFKDISIRLHQFYYSKGFSFFKGTNSHIVVRNLQSATHKFANLQVLGSLNLLNEIVVLFFIILFIAFYNLQILALLLLTVAPPFFLFYIWVRRRSIKLGEIRNRVEPILGKNFYQSIFGYVDVVITGSENLFRKSIKRNLDELVDIDIKAAVYNLSPTRVIETALMFAIAIIISFGVFYLPSKVELLKILGLFAVAGYRIMPSINRMMIAVNGLNQSLWIYPILAPLKGKNTFENNKKEKEIKFTQKLTLENISFSYPDNSECLFKNYSLTINKGEVIGLVGPSGAGKTTLMNILLGFLTPTRGDYKIDNTTLTGDHLKSYYKKIGYVQQQVYMIDGTLAENIAFGCKYRDINQNKLEEVLKKASLWEMVQNLPNGTNEIIGENGTKLSGGQRQRVGIARALYFDAEILFLDEATSSLDSQTEKEITDAIHLLSDGDLTIIIIAHRLSTLENCTRIIEVDQEKKLVVTR